MHPVLFRLGREPVYSYSIVMALIVPLTLLWALWQDRRSLDGSSLIFRATFWTMMASLLGGRLTFILGHWPTYQERPGEVLALWGGGINGNGAFIAGWLGLALFHRTMAVKDDPRLPFWAVVNSLTPVLPLVASAGWLAHLLAGSAYGREVLPGAFPLTVVWPDLYGLYASRIPTQLLGLALSLLMVPPLYAMRRGCSPQHQFPLFLIFYFAGLFLLEFTRGDEAMLVAGLRAGQWLAMAMVAVGVGLMWAFNSRGAGSLPH